MVLKSLVQLDILVNVIVVFKGGTSLVTEKNYIFVCRKCGRPHSSEEFNESRFCRNCGKFLSQIDAKPLNHVSTIKDKKYLDKEEILDLVEKHDKKNNSI
ncbi:unnamed protein product [marine sediment metagenome]|uniref:Zinc-ribbon domain-containing protein n=1 Tax=marine sediment metagenome TaxID=412755 RepID=X0V6F2_9ZZZZ